MEGSRDSGRPLNVQELLLRAIGALRKGLQVVLGQNEIKTANSISRKSQLPKTLIFLQ